MVKRKSQSDHDIMVQILADKLSSENWKNIKADIVGFDQPDKITWPNSDKGHIPDVTATKSIMIIVEVETDDSIDDNHTKDQWGLFSLHCTQPKMEFIVAVPKGSRGEAEKRAIVLNVAVCVIEV